MWQRSNTGKSADAKYAFYCKQKRDFFAGSPTLSPRAQKALKIAYSASREREYLSGSVSAPMNLRDEILDRYILQEPGVNAYCHRELKSIVIVADSELVRLENQDIKQRMDANK